MVLREKPEIKSSIVLADVIVLMRLPKDWYLGYMCV